jgi:translation elongation factor EF-Ts
VLGVATSDGKAASLVEINCNTDFTAKSEPLLKLGTEAARLLAHNPTPTSPRPCSRADGGLADDRRKRPPRQARRRPSPRGRQGRPLPLRITGKIGVSWPFTGNPSEELIKQIGGHIAFAKPSG